MKKLLINIEFKILNLKFTICVSDELTLKEIIDFIIVNKELKEIYNYEFLVFERYLKEKLDLHTSINELNIYNNIEIVVF